MDAGSGWLPSGAEEPTPEPDLVLELYRKLLLIRAFERETAAAYGRRQIHGTHRSSLGQEAVPIGVCHALDARDLVAPGLRGVGDVLARGGDPGRLMAELFGKGEGLCRGRAGALHLSDVSRGVIGGFAVMTANVPIAVGLALAVRARNEGGVVVCFIGDRATNQGVFHESMNAAALQELPVICVGVNNAPDDAGTSLSEHTAASSMAALADVHGIASRIVDGTDVIAVHGAAVAAVQRAREGGGPSFLECRCFPIGEPSRAQIETWMEAMRRDGHFEGLLAVKKREIGLRELQPPPEWVDGDPITRLARRIRSSGIASDGRLNEVRADIDAIVDAAVRFALDAPEPSLPDDGGVFASTTGEGDR